MNTPPRKPPPPSFEPPSDDPLGDLTDEDLEWVEQVHREGRLPDMTLEEALAEIEVDRKRFYDRLRRAGFDPGAKGGEPEKE